MRLEVQAQGGFESAADVCRRTLQRPSQCVESQVQCRIFRHTEMVALNVHPILDNRGRWKEESDPFDTVLEALKSE